jgi:hypothetical protein
MRKEPEIIGQAIEEKEHKRTKDTDIPVREMNHIEGAEKKLKPMAINV